MHIVGLGLLGLAVAILAIGWGLMIWRHDVNSFRDFVTSRLIPVGISFLPALLLMMVFVGEKEERAGSLSPSSRTGRTSASIWAIAWSIALFVFFNFFSDYIALHHGGGIREPLITAEFSQWLWIINTTLIISVIGHTIAVIFDRYILRESILVVINIFAIAAVAVLLSLFPFDFSIIPNADVAYWVDLGVQIGLIVTLVGLSIGTLVGLIKLIVNLAKGTKSY
jgi:hypothetical protein